LEAVARASEAYRAGLMNDAATTALTAGGVTPWVPIYRGLLAELRASLQAAGQLYDQAAASAGVPAADRFGWRRLLDGESKPDADSASDGV
jgi:hypothetical protein